MLKKAAIYGNNVGGTFSLAARANGELGAALS